MTKLITTNPRIREDLPPAAQLRISTIFTRAKAKNYSPYKSWNLLMRVKRIIEIALILFKLISEMYGVNYSSSFIILLISHYSSV